MCMACEEEALCVERGEIPPGFEPEDFEAAGLPVPPRRAAPVSDEFTSAYSPEDASSGPGADEPKVREPSNPFVCDAPDGK
jgi:hypothetical protein